MKSCHINRVVRLFETHCMSITVCYFGVAFSLYSYFCAICATRWYLSFEYLYRSLLFCW